jgi:hypothetical protein
MKYDKSMTDKAWKESAQTAPRGHRNRWSCIAQERGVRQAHTPALFLK